MSNNKLYKKIGISLLIGTMILPTTTSLLNNPIEVKALKGADNNDYVLTTVTRDATVQAELDDYYAHLDKMVEVAYNEKLLTLGNEIITALKEITPENVNEKTTEINDLWKKFASMTDLLTDDDLAKMDKNYDMFDNIYYSLYKLTDSITNLDDRATIQLNACKSIYYYAIKNGNNNYMNGYGKLFSDYNNIPEIKWSFLTIKDAAAATYRKLVQNSDPENSDDETVVEDKKDEILKEFEDYPFNENVGLTDDDVSIPEEPSGENGSNIIEDEKDENDEDSFWDGIKDVIEDVINNITGEDGENNAVVNSDVTYTSYTYSNGCYKVTKVYDSNGKLKSVNKTKGTTNSDLMYCSIAKSTSKRYPEHPNLSKYSIKSQAEYDEETSAIVYTLNKTLPNPQYYKTTIEITDGKISYEDTVELLKQVISKANGSYVDDGDSTMFMLEGKFFTVDKKMTFNKEKFDELSDMFNYIFVGFVSVDEEAEAAEQAGETGTLNINVEKVNVKGTELTSNVYVKNEQFMLPVEETVKAIGGTVEIDDNNNIVATINDVKYIINNSSNYIYTDSQTFTLLNKNEVSSSKLYADLQTVLESIGLKYDFNTTSKTLYIK